MEKIEALIKGGKASPAPPLGPALGPSGLNIGQVIKEINEKTASFAGMEVPVKILYDKKTKKFEIQVGKPPVTALIKKELKKDKLATVGEDKVRTSAGSITIEAAIKIAEMSKAVGTKKTKTKQIIGTCQSCGVLVNDKSPKDIITEINQGKHDNLFE